MKKPKTLPKSACVVWLIIVLSVAVGGLAGCASTRTGTGEGNAVRTLWSAHEQYVAVEQQDRSGGAAAPANAQPADVSVGRIREILASIAVRTQGNNQAIPLFNDDELATLGEQIHTGLASAGPDEDVTFAIIGHHAAFMGLLKRRMITLGRVFCQGGELNIIFGDVLRDVNDKEDRRLHPFLQGTRNGGGPREVVLTVRPEKEKFIMKRPDWVVFPIAGPVSTEGSPTAPEKMEKGGKPDTVVQPATPGKEPAVSGRKGIEERLMMLNDLKERRLITDEEYRAKRREILDEL